MTSQRPRNRRPRTTRRPWSRPQREFRALLDAVVDAVVIIDHSGIVEEFNRGAEQVFGYAAHEVVGRNVRELMPEPYRREHDEYLARYAATGQAHIIGIGREVQARRKDGSVFPCDLSVGQLRRGSTPRFVGFVRDISERKRGEERLRRSEGELQLAQELANLGNYVLHEGGDEPDYYSPQLLNIFGIAEQGGMRIARAEFVERWVHPADRELVGEALTRMIHGTHPIDIEYRAVLADGRLRHLHHIAQAVRGADGRVLKLVGTIHDITDRRHAEDDARQLQDRLTHFARLSTMGEMAAGLAHEINQPLSAIATYAQACQRMLRAPQPEFPDVLGALEQINVQALRAGEIIRRLRMFVKNRELKRELVDCGRLLDDLRTLAETDARQHDVRLRIDADEPLPTVYADPIQLQQVVLNLVRNAIDAMEDTPADRREVVLTTCRAEDGNIEIIVADHGTGVAPEASDYIFNPFFTTKAGGTGLGLAISRSIVRAHGGRLWHTSNEACGARFHFTLPASLAMTGG